MRVVLFLSAAIWAAAVMRAQQVPPAGQPPIATLKLLILQGRDAVNDVRGRAVTIPIIEVRDDNDQPVEGAQVVFEAPANGPGGSFPGNKITFTTRTNVQGQASAPFTANALPGRFVIQVTATSGDRFGRVSIPQMNGTVVPGSDDRSLHKSSRKKWWILGGIAAAAAVTVGVVLATRGDSAPAQTVTAPPVIVVTPGPPVIGGPR